MMDLWETRTELGGQRGDRNLGHHMLENIIEKHQLRDGIFLSRKYSMLKPGYELPSFGYAPLRPYSLVKMKTKGIKLKDIVTEYVEGSEPGEVQINVYMDADTDTLSSNIHLAYAYLKSNWIVKWCVILTEPWRGEETKFWTAFENIPHLWPNVLIKAMPYGTNFLLKPHFDGKTKYFWAMSLDLKLGNRLEDTGIEDMIEEPPLQPQSSILKINDGMEKSVLTEEVEDMEQDEKVMNDKEVVPRVEWGQPVVNDEGFTQCQNGNFGPQNEWKRLVTKAEYLIVDQNEDVDVDEDVARLDDLMRSLRAHNNTYFDENEDLERKEKPSSAKNEARLIPINRATVMDQDEDLTQHEDGGFCEKEGQLLLKVDDAIQKPRKYSSQFDNGELRSRKSDELNQDKDIDETDDDLALNQLLWELRSETIEKGDNFQGFQKPAVESGHPNTYKKNRKQRLSPHDVSYFKEYKPIATERERSGERAGQELRIKYGGKISTASETSSAPEMPAQDLMEKHGNGMRKILPTYRLFTRRVPTGPLGNVTTILPNVTGKEAYKARIERTKFAAKIREVSLTKAVLEARANETEQAKLALVEESKNQRDTPMEEKIGSIGRFSVGKLRLEMEDAMRLDGHDRAIQQRENKGILPTESLSIKDYMGSKELKRIKSKKQSEQRLKEQRRSERLSKQIKDRSENLQKLFKGEIDDDFL